MFLQNKCYTFSEGDVVKFELSLPDAFCLKDFMVKFQKYFNKKFVHEEKFQRRTTNQMFKKVRRGWNGKELQNLYGHYNWSDL